VRWLRSDHSLASKKLGLIRPRDLSANTPLPDLLFFAPTLCSVVPVLLFCQCGSDRVDVSTWNGSRARLRCFSCNHECWLEGFTVSEFDPAKLLTGAIVDQARKHRKRSPEEIARVQSARVLDLTAFLWSMI
jgi:hypothetical protein